MTRWLASACTLPVLLMTACGASDMKSDGNMTIKQEVAYDAEEGYFGDVSYENAEEYGTIIENQFISTAEEPVSTFSIDVDTASYSNIRRMLRDGGEVVPDAVRIEEIINYFSYDYPAPAQGEPFSVTTELSDCPWNESSKLLLIGLQADEIDLANRAPMNLVFLIDVSGSMYSADKLPLVQKAMAMLAENLDENDRISVVTYAGMDTVVMEGVPGSEYEKITEGIYSLEAGGSTAGEAGIRRAYAIAEENFIEGGNNRILLATDGDLNVGLSSQEDLKKLVEKKRESGVNLSVLGFGTGNLKDDRLETLADNGNGSYAYIDSELEARKVLVQEMGGTLYTVAKDVKIQAQFDPRTVESYRLVGYENRVMRNEDFQDDTKDAGEIGAGHSVTALYEVKMQAEPGEQLMNLALRYKEPAGSESRLLEYPVSAAVSPEIPQNSAFAAAAAEFGMLLRDSSYMGLSSYPQIQRLLEKTDMTREYRQEFAELAQIAFGDDPKYGEKTEPVIPAEIPAASPTEAFSEDSSDVPVQEETQSDDPTAAPLVTATFQGNVIQLSHPERIVTIMEQMMDYSTLMTASPTAQDFTDAAQNGWMVSIRYDADAGKEIFFLNTDKPLYIYEIDLLLDDAHQWAVVNNGGTWQIYALPQWAADELSGQQPDILE